MAFTQVIKTLGSVMATMKTAVDSWLSENITNPSNPPLDRSLSLDNACAPADMVGDLKNEIDGKADIIRDSVTNVPIATVPDGASNLPLTALVIGIEPVQDTSGGDPSPSHVCPITGWTGCNVTRTGVNLYNEENYPLSGVNKYIDATDGKVKNNSGTLCVESFIPFAGLDGLEITLNKAPGWWSAGVAFYSDANEASFISGATNSGTQAGTPFTFIVPSGTKYIRFTTTATATDIQLELSSTASAYTPFVGQTYPISWQTEAGTVYGGTLDPVNGVLTVVRAIVDLGTLTWYASATGEFNTNKPSDCKSGVSTNVENIICTKYKTASRNGQPDFSIALSPSYLFVKDSTYSDATTFNTAMSGVKLVYELATPIEIPLSDVPQISTLKGVNNLWADCGDVKLLEYPCDTKGYVEKRLSASQTLMELIVTANRESEMKASKAYSTGNLLIVNGTLYKATTSIANGATLTPGTNVTATTVAAELAALA